MMRALVLLGGFSLVTAESHTDKIARCVLNGAEAASEMLDATVFTWAAAERCGKVGQDVKCEIDIASAIKSANSMINVILNAMGDCGMLHTVNAECGMVASKLTQSMAGIAAASGSIVQKCKAEPPHTTANASADPWAHANAAMCVVDLKGSMKSLLVTVTEISQMKSHCQGGSSDGCANNAMKLVAALAGLGEYLSGSYGHCSQHAVVAECGEAISELIHNLVKVAHDGNVMRVQCSKSSSWWGSTLKHIKEEVEHEPVQIEVDVPVEVKVGRLFEQEGDTANKGGISPNLVLASFLPVIAVLSFIGGRFYSLRRSVSVAAVALPVEQTDPAAPLVEQTQ